MALRRARRSCHFSFLTSCVLLALLWPTLLEGIAGSMTNPGQGVTR